MTDTEIQPIKLYGCDISYFTGKLEMYFRSKGIPYQFVSMTMSTFEGEIRQQTGIAQMPALQLGDGRWMTDSTPIIDWFETEHPTPAITPTDPVQRFFSLLLEDYADEWLWRPAMHFRWYNDEGAMYASRRLVNTMGADAPGPGFIKRFMIRRRQRNYTVGDGITEQNRLAVESIYDRNLAALEAILQQRPYLLGASPSLADIGFMGSMFRHFGEDPLPSEIMRQSAPAVAEWIARLWNYKPAQTEANWLPGVPADWKFWLNDIGETYLPYLCANAEAVAAGKKNFDCEVGGAHYRGAHVSRYRVWCLEQLRHNFDTAPETVKPEMHALLEKHNCWEPLWRSTDLDSQVNQQRTPPFHGDSKMVV